MNKYKYITGGIITLVCLVYITSLITFAVVKSGWQEELNTCKGMNNTYIEEIQKRTECINRLNINNSDSCGTLYD